MIWDVLGWMGMALVLFAYMLLSLNKIKNGKVYQLMNLVAAALMAVALLPKNAWFSFVLQVAWAVIAVISLVKMGNRGKRK